jgi:hypothetical protein
LKPGLCLAVAAILPLHAAPEWAYVKSQNFELYSNASPKEAEKTIEYFEQVRDFFMRVTSTEVTTRF